MKLELVEKKANALTFTVKDSDEAYVNALRRYMMNEVPVMAIEDVEIRKNSSIMYDEVIAHRLGLVPLSTDLKSYNLPEECKCKGAGCAQCSVTLTLKAKADKEPLTIYAKQIKSKDPKVKPVYPDTPLLRLHPGQEFECEMKAVLGKGREHAKWSPCLAWFKHYPYVTVKKQPEDAEAIAQAYPGVFEVKKGKLVLNEKELLTKDLVDEKVEELSKGVVTYKEKNDFVFFVESWGQLPVAELVEKAVELHGKDLSTLKKLLKEVKSK